jgi:hypothetical protein
VSYGSVSYRSGGTMSGDGDHSRYVDFNEAAAADAFACDTPDIMGFRSVLNQLSPIRSNRHYFNLLQAKVDSNLVA